MFSLRNRKIIFELSSIPLPTWSSVRVFHIFIKEENSCDFLFAALGIRIRKGSTLKEKNFGARSKFFPVRVDSCLKRGKMAELLPLKITFHLTTP